MSAYENKIRIEKLETEIERLKSDVTAFTSILIQAGVVECISNADGKQEYKIHKVAVDGQYEPVQQG